MSTYKPISIHKLHGTYRADRHADKVNYSTLSAVPKCPKNWPEEAKELWKITAQELVCYDLLQVTDLPTLKTYVWACYQQDLAFDKLGSEGYVLKDGKHSPWIRVYNDASKILATFARRFGFSPIDRARIVLPKRDEENLFDSI